MLEAADCNEDSELSEEADGFEGEEEDPGVAEFTDYADFKPNTGYGTLLIDARNAFNEINRYLMLWTAHHRWNRGSRFAFNRYRHHNIVYVRSHPGHPPHIILSKEGVAQGCVFGMFLYGIGLLPLCEQMRAQVPESLQTWFADDGAATGEAVHGARCLDFLVREGPKYGYYPEPEKSWYICKGEDEEVAKQAFEEFGLTVPFTRGHRYLGSFLGCGVLKQDWIEAKVEAWRSAVEVLSNVAIKFPQSAYCGYTICLQSERQYLPLHA